MNFAAAFILFVLALLLALAGATRLGAWAIERRNPPVGQFAGIGGANIHYVRIPQPAGANLPPIVFIHGASANLKDQMVPFAKALAGRAELLFFDRPGHGWSTRGATNGDPHGQAATIAALMDGLGISRPIIVGHSFGGAVAATFAVDFPDKVGGLVFLSAASHPWPGGKTSWYYDLASVPIIGRLFAETLAWPGGKLQMQGATDCVFSPNKAPETYLRDASIELVLRPSAFRANSLDVQGLYRHAQEIAPRYREINTPTVVISGDRDTVVYEEIHSVGLGRDIPGAELVWIHNLGHKSDWIATDLAIAAIEKTAGLDRDLTAAARIVEERIAADKFGVGVCVDEKPALGKQLDTTRARPR
jgi:pimeloyl-ACP methyl ester carboxylesterase